jgi:NTE family protein
VLKYLLTEIPHSQSPGFFRVLSGISVGAINACFLASYADRLDYNVKRLESLWSMLDLERVLRLGAWDFVRLPYDLRRLFNQDPRAEGVILNSQLLQRIVVRGIRWKRIHKHVDQGLLDAVTVTATHIHSGKSVVFVDARTGQLPTWSRDRRVVARATDMLPQHALASAAIPFIFPPIPIENSYYCDGGVRQSTPLSPPLRFGANRVLVIPLWHVNGAEEQARDVPEPFPSAALMLGKLLNALLLDRLDYDLARLTGLNNILRDGRAAFGSAFDDAMSASSKRVRGVPYQEVESVVVRPSRDIGQLAREFLDEYGKELGFIPGWALKKLASSSTGMGESDLVSYLLFDRIFAKSLIELGMHDADANRQALIDYMRD